MKPVLFEFMNHEIYSYTVFNILALLAGTMVFILEAKGRKISGRTITIVLVACFIGGSIGSKVPIWIYYFKTIIDSLPDLNPVFSGRTVVGGIIGGWVFVEVAKKMTGIKISTGDLFAPAIALGLAVGRIGCFLGGCCYGIECDLPWAFNFGDGVMRHPTQLYSMIFDLALFVYLTVIGGKTRREGEVFRRFLLIYFIFRFFIEFIRTSPRILFFLTGFQITSIAVLIYLAVTYFMKTGGRILTKQIKDR
jgi:phosphatidylglycerol---prolipoprotein diacylglyceryl transferase